MVMDHGIHTSVIKHRWEISIENIGIEMDKSLTDWWFGKLMVNDG